MAQPNPIAQKCAYRFTKTGPAQFHSHLDLVRFFERAVRRAGLPVRRTAGYHPHPRIVFPHAIGVGIASRHEWVEMEFTRIVSAEETAAALDAAVRPVFAVREHRDLPPVKSGLRAEAAAFRCGGFADADALASAVRAFRSESPLPVTRKRKDRIQTIDLRAGVDGPVARGQDLTFQVDLAAGKSPRPDEIVRWIAARSGDVPEDLTLVKTGMRLRGAQGDHIESTDREPLA